MIDLLRVKRPLIFILVILAVFGYSGLGHAKPAFGYGGSGGFRAPTPSVSSSADVTGDNQVNALDFNTLMVDWGRAGSGLLADINGDNLVDLLDFNMLMVYWQ